jgi:HSP20 family protein
MAQLTRWEPVGEFSKLRRQMDRMFEDWPRFLGRRIDEEGLRGEWMPAVDIHETEGTFEVTADLPGFDAKDVDVSVQENTLTIRGERKREEIKENETIHRVEREYGIFERSFSLPRSADAENIQAKYKDGVLSLTIHKKEEAKAKPLKIDVEK